MGAQPLGRVGGLEFQVAQHGGPGGAVLPVDPTASPRLWAPVQSWPRSSFVPLGRFLFF